MKKTLHQWLDWLEKREPLPIQKIFRLTDVKIVAKRLQLLPITQPVITVTGTNGKGSCVAFCEAIYTAAGYTVGAYFSPHVFSFNERIHCHGAPVSDEKICEAFEIIDQARGEHALTYFEFATLAALWIFKQENVDIYILEIGVGGRLDTVNIVDATVAVITSIDIDHVHWLGNTREKIGFEKAGIYRANRHAICGDPNVPMSVIEYVQKINAIFSCYVNDFCYQQKSDTWSWWNKHTRIDHLPLPILSMHNAAIALQTVMCLSLPLTDAVIKKGIATAYLPGRFQIIEKPVFQIFDVAHNPASAKFFAKRLQTLPSKGKTFAIIGMLKDKDIAGTVAPLLPWIDVWYVASLGGMRGASAIEFVNVANFPNNTTVVLFDHVIMAYQAALKAAKSNDRIIVFGSFHTVGEICNQK